MTELILHKLGSREFISDHMLDVVQRAQHAGLHKVAASMRGTEEFTFRDAILELSTKYAHAHLKRKKIASGMRALLELDAAGDIKLGGLNAAALRQDPIRSIGQYLRRGGPPAPPAAQNVGARELLSNTAAKPQLRASEFAASATEQAAPRAMAPLPAMSAAQPAKLPMGRLPTAP